MKIAVAVDGSDNALRAAKHAIMLAQYLPEAHLEIIYVADYNKAKDERLLAQSPESLALKREQKIQPVAKTCEIRWSRDKDYDVKRKSKSGNNKVCERTFN